MQKVLIFLQKETQEAIIFAFVFLYSSINWHLQRNLFLIFEMPHQI